MVLSLGYTPLLDTHIDHDHPTIVPIVSAECTFIDDFPILSPISVELYIAISHDIELSDIQLNYIFPLYLIVGLITMTYGD